MLITDADAVRYATTFQGEDHKMRNDAGQPLKGWFVDLPSIQDLMASVPAGGTLTGIQVYLGTNDVGGQQLILARRYTDAAGKPMIDRTRLHDFLEQCPTNCPANSLI